MVGLGIGLMNPTPTKNKERKPKKESFFAGLGGEDYVHFPK